MNTAPKITLGELSRVTGVSKDALMRMERRGQIDCERRAGGRRYFDAVLDPARVNAIVVNKNSK